MSEDHDVDGGPDAADEPAVDESSRGSATGEAAASGGSSDPDATGAPSSPEPDEPPLGADSRAGAGAGADVDVAELTGPERRLHPRVRFIWLLQAAILALVLGAVALVLGVVTEFGVLPGPVVFVVVFVVSAALAVLRYRRWRYEVREDSLYLERGVVTHVRTVVPYVRIQHVDASRGPLERLLGLSTTVVYTAGSRGADVSIPGLTPERADDLQERLKRLAIAAEGEDAV